MSGRRIECNVENTYTGNVAEFGPLTNCDTIVLSRLNVKESSPPASSAGATNGRVI